MDAGAGPSFGALLRQARRDSSLSQEALAERAGVSARVISDIERDVIRAPRRDTLALLADALELPAATRAEWERLRRRLSIRADAAGDSASRKPMVLRPRSNLPASVDTLLGRDRELSDVSALLNADRLVTLTGPGGIGKTRLALEVARASWPSFRDGVTFINLAALRDPSLVLPTIARTLDVQATGGQSLIDRVGDFLRNKHVLLLLDNFEQVIDAAPVVTDLLERAPALKALATSRTRLRLRGERSYSVPPLAVPNVEAETVQALHDSPAIALFLDRATAVEGAIDRMPDSLRLVAEICRRLDGLPLAIELAAARTATLSLQAITSRLDDRLGFLTGGPRDLPNRQQTQRATIDWSHDLLDAPERRLFRECAVFSGGWTLDAAEAVSGGDDDRDINIQDTLIALVESNLVSQRLLDDGEARYGMLETIREYAIEQLSASGDEAAVRSRHANVVLALVELLGPQLHGPDQQSALERLEREHDNIRAALDWLHASEDAERGLRLAGSLAGFWQVHGHLSEGRTQLERLLAHRDETVSGKTLATAFTGAGLLAEWQEDDRQATRLLETALDIWRDLPEVDQRGAAMALSHLGRIATRQGNFAVAHDRHQEMLAHARRMDDARGVRLALHQLGNVAGERGQLAEAGRFWEESLALSRATGDIGQVARTLNNLGVMYQALDQYDHARPYLQEAIVTQRRLGDKTRLMNTLKNFRQKRGRPWELRRSIRLLRGGIGAGARNGPTGRSQLHARQHCGGGSDGGRP
jgi:predicted ATPase/DNA-binding XRE family transcriptional regulator